MSFEYTERTRWGVLSKVSEIRSKHGGWSKVSETGTGMGNGARCLEPEQLPGKQKKQTGISAGLQKVL